MRLRDDGIMPRRFDIAGAATFLLVLIICGWVTCTLLSVPAASAPPPDSDGRFSDFYKSLTGPNGVSCCGPGDCRPVDPVSTGDPENPWKVVINGRVYLIPRGLSQVRDDNPTGRSIACAWNGRIVCFFRLDEV